MKIVGTIGLFSALTLLAGCGTAGPKLDMNKVAAAYYAQQRTRVYPAIQVTGANDFHIAGSNMTLTVNTHMEPLSLIPRDPTITEALIPAARDTILGGLGILGAAQVMTKMADQPRTVEPTVVQPTVVQPEVIEVPAGAGP